MKVQRFEHEALLRLMCWVRAAATLPVTIFCNEKDTDKHSKNRRQYRHRKGRGGFDTHVRVVTQQKFQLLLFFLGNDCRKITITSKSFTFSLPFY